ncbi:heparan-alpha-glucosaminide N-acetyltransferase [Aureimonas sp. SK2]|uniref:heparan-alpha-glucosaminide N-acetyltransferase n=1 Tax=Aureimonas sp. SK2 TaxID=3015992 RepID=UPI002444E4CD|nr:heparan-alpha-glucosaminide N-acetyltransferase [Aureimonas sp. SK2]
MQETKAVRFGSRVELLDVTRGVALLAMLVYHFTWDLEFFGYLPPGYAQVGGWRLFARSIAVSFLVLVGIGLVLAHRQEVRWPAFARRLGQIAAGAAVISIATYAFTPDSFVFFGILHLIAVASVLGLLFIRLPFAVNLALAALLVALPLVVSTPLTDSRWLAWIGMSERAPISNDFVPLIPWLAPVIVGIALAQMAERFGLWPRLRRLNGRLGPARHLERLGRHSLMFYLVHQPISIGLIAGFAYLYPPDQTAAFDQSCRRTCAETRDEGFCQRYCGCVRSELQSQDLLGALLSGRLDDAQQDTVRRTVDQCSFSAEP